MTPDAFLADLDQLSEFGATAPAGAAVQARPEDTQASAKAAAQQTASAAELSAGTPDDWT